jgi:hypothetical protein
VHRFFVREDEKTPSPGLSGDGVFFCLRFLFELEQRSCVP